MTKFMAKITYTDKVALNVNSEVADINKCNASDLNEIKTVVNTNDTNALYKSNVKTSETTSDSDVYSCNYVNDLLDILHPIGEYYETSNASFNPNTSWTGTWVLENDGTVLVSKSNISGSKFNTTIGTIIGEETHTLTVNELASHGHTVNYSSSGGTSIGVTAMGNKLSDSSSIIQKTGGDQPHNNVQPSKIVYRWHRTA